MGLKIKSRSIQLSVCFPVCDLVVSHQGSSINHLGWGGHGADFRKWIFFSETLQTFFWESPNEFFFAFFITPPHMINGRPWLYNQQIDGKEFWNVCLLLWLILMNAWISFRRTSKDLDPGPDLESWYISSCKLMGGFPQVNHAFKCLSPSEMSNCNCLLRWKDLFL